MSGETRRPWSPEEDLAIRNIVDQLGTKKWSQISQAMQDRFHLFGRSGKQCRQRWHNHLAPEVSKRPWSNEEEQTLFEAHKKHGNKWTEISKLIQGRTDNAIKNHFYSSIRRSLRRINKILGSKNSTVKMRNVKPAVLSAIFNLADQQQGNNSQDYKDLTLALIQFSRSRVKKDSNVTQDEKLGLEALMKRLMAFNDLYEKEKRINKFNAFGNETSKLQSQLSSESKKDLQEQDLEQDQQQAEVPQNNEQACKMQPSIAGQGPSETHSPKLCKQINLQQSEYDWQQFQQRCETIVNRYLVSQCSLKSMECLGYEDKQGNHGEADGGKMHITPAKSEKESSCSYVELKVNPKNGKTGS